MFYKFIRVVVRVIVAVINGNWHVHGKENLPDDSYIIVAPHRNWWEPIFFALAISPKQAAFMAKEELFKNPIIAYILNHSHAISVDRKDPGPSVIKKPVHYLKKEKYVLVMFPSGTRYSKDLKGGSVLISKMSQKPLVPVVYQGPLTFKDLLKRQKITIGIGKPIYVDRKIKVNEESIETINNEMESSWSYLDSKINPDFKYIPKSKK